MNEASRSHPLRFRLRELGLLPALALALLVCIGGGSASAFGLGTGPGASGAVGLMGPILAERPILKTQFYWPFRRERRVRRARPNPRARQRQQQRARPRAAVPRGEDGKLAGTKTENPNATRVVVFGDSVAKDLYNGMLKSLGKDESFEVLRKTKVSSGVVRDDFYNWQDAVNATLAEGRLDIAIFMLGINDLQQMRSSGGRFEPLSPEWLEIYKSCVDNIVKAFQEKGTAVYWVGLPIVRSPRLSRGYTQINQIVKERMDVAGARFIDIWDGFADANGAYSAYGPDISGERRKMRKGNGIHFSTRGNEKLVHFVEQAVQTDIAGSGQSLDGRRVIRQGARGGLVISSAAGDNSAGNELAGAGDPAAGGVQMSSLQASKPAVPTVVPGKPMMLNAPGEGDGEQSSSGGKTDGEEVVSPLFTVLMRGEALPPKSGRADDFAWDDGSAEEPVATN